ncbi:MAG TPA: extracellular solute-binding protein [Candidatus Eisenbacteria bacterium]|nr:extracellular solute-binding protein [Candidatus Eisenbacteria bacterium]
MKKITRRTACLIVGVALLTPIGTRPAVAQTAGSILQKYSALAANERKKALEAGAKKEGLVNFYGTMSVKDAQVLIKEFHEHYPYLKVQHIRLGSSPLLSRILTEHRGGRRDVDVVAITGPGAQVLIERGLIDPYFSAERGAIRSDFVSPKGLWSAVELYLVVLGYNTKSVAAKDVPKSYEDLLDSKWTNSISLDQTDEDWFHVLGNEWGEDKAVDYLTRLMKLNPRLHRGRELRAQMVAAGEFPIALTLYDYRVRNLKEQGATINSVALPPIMAFPNVAMLARHAPHPHAAALFIDFLLSERGQKLIESELGRDPTRKGLGRGMDETVGGRPMKVIAPDDLGPKTGHYLKLYRKITGQ